MSSDDLFRVSMSREKFNETFKEDLKNLVLEDTFFWDKHFFEYVTLFQLQEKEGLLTEKEFEIIKKRLSPECCYVESYPISSFLKDEDILVSNDAIPISLLEFLISKPQNYFSLQKIIFNFYDDPLYAGYNLLDDDGCVINHFGIGKKYLEQLHGAMRELYDKLVMSNYNLSSESLEMLKMFSERKVTGENILFLIKYMDFSKSAIKKDEFINRFDVNLVDGVIELLKKEDVTKEEIDAYLKENDSLVGYKNYIFLIKTIKDVTDTFLDYDENLVKNTDDIFYRNDIFYDFYPKMANYLDEDEFVNDLGEQLSGELDGSILSYVKENLPDNLNGTKELAYCLYVLLGDILQYDAAFVLDKDRKLNWMKDLTIDNNKVICSSWSVSYYKLLEQYGIESYIDGFEHFSVFIPCDHTVYNADATSILEGLSDLANIKFNFYSQGFMVDSVFSSSSREMEFRMKELEVIKKAVYEKLGRKVVKEEEFQRRALKFKKILLERIFYKEEFTKDDIEKTIRRLNHIYKIPLGLGADVERGEFFNKYIDMIIDSFPTGQVESISLYRVENEVVSYTHLLRMEESCGENHLYLETDKGLVAYDVLDILDGVASGKFVFHNPIAYEKVKVLGKKPNEVVSAPGETNK